MHVLVTNDDGIAAEGISQLAQALSQVAKVYVCAPDTERSAVGHGITIRQPIQVMQVPFSKVEKAYSFAGTPADCVKIGTKLLGEQGIKIDMVFSGINHGGNLGTDTLYSGTVSAAIEGCLCGYPSVALSVNSHNAVQFEMACQLAQKTCQRAHGKLGAGTVLNINTPNLPPEEIKGIKYTRLGNREYKEWFRSEQLEDGSIQYRYTGEPVVYEGLPDDIDVIAMQNGYATITPLQYNLTDDRLVDEIKNWRIHQ